MSGEEQEHLYSEWNAGCRSHHSATMTELRKDDIYAFALSKTLMKMSAPATIGLYSSCQDRITMILKQIEEYMNQETTKIEQKHSKRQKPRAAKLSFTDQIALVLRLLFYKAVWAKDNQNRHSIRFIYVDFSAWHFAGSDLLWAGIAIRLCEAVRLNFGKVRTALYRVVQHDEEEEVKTTEDFTDVHHGWNPRKVCCFPLWSLVLLLLTVFVILLIVVFTSDLQIPGLTREAAGNETATDGDVLKGVLVPLVGAPAAGILIFVFQMVKNIIFNPELNIKKGMDSESISSQLGFMDKVRKEIWLLSQFVHFMEVFEGRRICIVLKITNLDRCSPKKIVAVLDAINILLSDEESPFLSILAVNPIVLLQKVNFAESCYCKEDRGYALLNRIVTLTFTVPPLCADSKRDLFKRLTDRLSVPEHSAVHVQTSGHERASGDLPLEEIVGMRESDSLMPGNEEPVDVKEVETLVQRILEGGERRLNRYMLDDAISMRRTISSVWVGVIIMKALKLELTSPENIAAWVVLANQWPCRFSWIIQCVEDEKQRAAIDHCDGRIDDSKRLWDVFSESGEELHVMSAHIEHLLEQDGDPEVFEELLKDANFEFTLRNLEEFKAVMVNLEQPIQRELALIRGTSRLKDAAWMRNVTPLSVSTLIKMSTEELCREMDRMKLSQHLDTVKKNQLNGSSLVFGDAEELKALLNMKFGEWVTFRLRFLSFTSHLRPVQNTPPCPSENPRLSPPHHGPHQH